MSDESGWVKAQCLCLDLSLELVKFSYDVEKVLVRFKSEMDEAK